MLLNITAIFDVFILGVCVPFSSIDFDWMDVLAQELTQDVGHTTVVTVPQIPLHTGLRLQPYYKYSVGLPKEMLFPEGVQVVDLLSAFQGYNIYEQIRFSGVAEPLTLRVDQVYWTPNGRYVSVYTPRQSYVSANTPRQAFVAAYSPAQSLATKAVRIPTDREYVSYVLDDVIFASFITDVAGTFLILGFVLLFFTGIYFGCGGHSGEADPRTDFGTDPTLIQRSLDPD
jgi:hypothetical protein